MKESLKSNKLELIALAAFLGIFVYQNFISPSVKQDQKSDKSEMRGNPSKDFDKGKNLITHFPPPSKYDPNLDYDDLAWNAYYETHRGEKFAEEVKKIIDSNDLDLYD